MPMKCNIDTDNRFFLRGRIVRTNIYAGGKAANITIAVKCDNENESDNFVNCKSFNTNVFDEIKKGMSVEAYGHIGSGVYVDKEGNIKYKDNNDLIIDTIVFNETKKTTQRRELENILNG